MFRGISNRWYRDRDPTRDWVADPSRLIVDVHRCTLCGGALGGSFAELSALGRSENARQAMRGLPEWRSRGVYCTIEDDLLADFTLIFDATGRRRSFPGIVLNDGQPLAISEQTTPEQVQRLLGEPFGSSDADGERVLFYEYAAGEVQYSFHARLGVLEAIELAYEPELSWPHALEGYGIGKAFPDEFRRRLPEPGGNGG